MTVIPLLAKDQTIELHHKDWAGFAFCDLIFPLFIFMVGISIVFSLSKIIAREGRTSSFILMASGYSCLLMGAFYLIIEVCNFRFWALPLV